MSAPPIAAVVVNPLIKLSMVLAPRNDAATRGAEGARERKPAMVRAFAPNRELLTKCFPGSVKGFEDMRPANFKNATIEPVKVIPPGFRVSCTSFMCGPKDLPITTPRYAVTRCKVEICEGSARTLPILVKTAASPTTECNAATICGSSVAVTRLPIIEPTVPPMAATPANWARTAGGKPTAANEDKIPELTPRIPKALPCLAVA
jgi:hypothetical protein